jgi:enterochelin esterase-like enzyme
MLRRLIQNGMIPVSLILSGCTITQLQPMAVTEPVIKTAIVLPSIIPTASQTPYLPQIPTVTPTAQQCSETQGVIINQEIPSAVLGETIRTKIYLPPCYDANQSGGYPYIVLLHGQNGDENQWIDLGITALADDYIIAGEAPQILMFFPFERAYLVDSYQSQYPQALLQDFLPGIHEGFNLKSGRENNAIGGISRGADWAVRIGMTEWQAFGKIGAHSFTTFYEDFALLPGWLEKLPLDQTPQFAFDIGAKDIYFEYCDRFVNRLKTAGVPLSYQVNEGGHTINYWSSHLEEYLKWYVKDWPVTLTQ